MTKQVAEVLAFVKATKRIGWADPSEVDEYLRRGSVASSYPTFEMTQKCIRTARR